mmetsp:Transcript_8438/g.21313  ORF Transcript_8438/g.21313 Transcript_8438/m.21313 type:complete len:661 (-) Transcript_8438:84-2066(-)
MDTAEDSLPTLGSGPVSLGEHSDFWRDIPDEILEELYPKLSSSDGQPGDSSNVSAMVDDERLAALMTNYGMASGSGSLPPLFPSQPVGVDGLTVLDKRSRTPLSEGMPHQKRVKSEQFGAVPTTSKSSSSSSVASAAVASGSASASASSSVSTSSTPVPLSAPIGVGSVNAHPSGVAATDVLCLSQLGSLSEQVFGEAMLKEVRITLDSVHARLTMLENDLQSLRSRQAELLAESAGKRERIAVNGLMGEHRSRLAELDDLLLQVYALKRRMLLPTRELHLVRDLSLRLSSYKDHIGLLYEELASRDKNTGLCQQIAILQVDMPMLPQVVFKGKSLEDSFVLRLITGTQTTVKAASMVRSTLLSDAEKKWKTDKPVLNGEARLESAQQHQTYQKLCSLSNVKINVSTRMNVVHLQFVVQLNTADRSATTVKSTPLYPVIVITNESQWSEAAGKLLIMDAFGSQADIPWPLFANTMHAYFLKATRQDASAPVRAISLREWDYFQQKYFGGAANVTPAAAVNFWNWFGQATQTLRFKRHISALWFSGLIFGVLTKDECAAALQHQPAGTFLVRFSETYPGLFAVAFVTEDIRDRLKHILVKPDDTGSTKSLPDFLREKPQFRLLLKMSTQPPYILQPLPKDSVLQSYYSKKNIIKPSGYVLL